MKQLAQIFLLLLLGLPFFGQAQTRAYFQADSTHVETGNLFVMQLVVTGDKVPDSLDFSPWQPFVKPENIREQSAWKRKGTDRVCDISLLFFDADTISLPPLAIVFGPSDTVYTAAFELSIEPTPSPDDLNDMAPIKDIRREPVLWTDYLPWAAAILGVLLLLGWLFWRFSRTKKPTVRKRAIERPPHELAFKKLEVLESKKLWQKGEVKAYCAELTFILREYLEKRYHVLALESISDELLVQLKATNFPQEFNADLENVLTQTDLVKFAKGVPGDDFFDYSFDFTRTLVDRTKAPIQLELTDETPE